MASTAIGAAMDLNKVIRDLYEEKKRLDQIIVSLEALQNSPAMAALMAPGLKRRGRKFMDAEARLEVSRRMKKYWAGRRSGEVGRARPGKPSPESEPRGSSESVH